MSLLLSQLLAALPQPVAQPARDPAISAVTDDNRTVQPGSLFVAYKGVGVDAHRFIRSNWRSRGPPDKKWPRLCSRISPSVSNDSWRGVDLSVMKRPFASRTGKPLVSTTGLR